MSKEELKEKISNQLPVLKDKYHVKKLGIFGSVARGQENNSSDVDIIVDFESPIGFFDFIRLENFLSEVLQKKVDLVSRNAVKPAIKDEVIKETIYV